MTTPDPVDPFGDDSPTSAVDLPPSSPPQAPADPPPPMRAAPWDAPGPIPPGGTWAAAPAPTSGPTPAATPGPTPDPTAVTGYSPSGYAAPIAGPADARPPAGPRSDAPPGLVAGIILVVAGVAFLLIRVADMALGSSSWPLWLIVPGLAMLAGSFAIPPRGGLGLAVPGTMIAIVGGILWVQDAYGLYSTWAYAWALVAPTGPGLAILLYGLVRGDHELASDGLRTFLVGIGLFLGFALFFEGVIGISGHRVANLDEVLPYVLVGFGVLLVVASLFVGPRDRGDRRASRRA
jgi:hypothetical protein